MKHSVTVKACTSVDRMDDDDVERERKNARRKLR
jgi:hypothetical protein